MVRPRYSLVLAIKELRFAIDWQDVLVRDFTDPIDVPEVRSTADIMLAAAGLILESIVKLSAAPVSFRRRQTSSSR